MVFLQTSCSKEKSTEQLRDNHRKSSPAPLNRELSEITAFYQEYQAYKNGESYEFQTLSVDDAEWILEAALNYEHRIEDWSGVDEYRITYTDDDSSYIAVQNSGGNPVFEDAELFSILSDMILESNNYTDIGPVSDIEIYMDGSSNAFVVKSFGLLDISPFNFPPPKWQYTAEYYRSWQVDGNIKSKFYYANGGGNCSGTTGPNSWEILTHNLKVQHAYGPFPKPRFWVSINNFLYGEDPTDPNDYLGPNNEDYSLSIYGAYPWTVNSSSIANGSYGQCLTKAQVQDFESAINTIINDRKNDVNFTPRVLDVNVKATETDIWDSPNHSGRWTYHKVKIRIGDLIM